MSTAGWKCPMCYSWVPDGVTHSCAATPVHYVPHQQTYYTPQPDWVGLVGALRSIEVRLAAIAEALSRTPSTVGATGEQGLDREGGVQKGEGGVQGGFGKGIGD
jgi:hypothetical protein